MQPHKKSAKLFHGLLINIFWLYQNHCVPISTKQFTPEDVNLPHTYSRTLIKFLVDFEDMRIIAKSSII